MKAERLGSYAGIGSRRTPADVLELMEALAAKLWRQPGGWLLRSGGADGADQAFERGVAAAGGDWETYRVDGGWCGLEDLTPGGPTAEAYELAAKVHPAWERCSPRARALHARNCHQVLGPDLDHPVRFVVCWTPDGSLDGAARESGGTGQALRVAVRFSVPVFNLCHPEHRHRVETIL